MRPPPPAGVAAFLEHLQVPARFERALMARTAPRGVIGVTPSRVGATRPNVPTGTLAAESALLELASIPPNFSPEEVSLCQHGLFLR